jgi:hypothetical protein
MGKYIDGTPDLGKSNAKLNNNFTSKIAEVLYNLFRKTI